MMAGYGCFIILKLNMTIKFEMYIGWDHTDMKVYIF